MRINLLWQSILRKELMHVSDIIKVPNKVPKVVNRGTAPLACGEQGLLR